MSLTVPIKHRSLETESSHENVNCSTNNELTDLCFETRFHSEQYSTLITNTYSTVIKFAKSTLGGKFHTHDSTHKTKFLRHSQSG